MPDTKNWNTLVTEFGRLIGADGFEIETAGACRLELGDGLGIDYGRLTNFDTRNFLPNKGLKKTDPFS